MHRIFVIKRKFHYTGFVLPLRVLRIVCGCSTHPYSAPRATRLLSQRMLCWWQVNGSARFSLRSLIDAEHEVGQAASFPFSFQAFGHDLAGNLFQPNNFRQGAHSTHCTT